MTTLCADDLGEADRPILQFDNPLNVVRSAVRLRANELGLNFVLTDGCIDAAVYVFKHEQASAARAIEVGNEVAERLAKRNEKTRDDRRHRRPCSPRDDGPKTAA